MPPKHHHDHDHGPGGRGRGRGHDHGGRGRGRGHHGHHDHHHDHHHPPHHAEQEAAAAAAAAGGGGGGGGTQVAQAFAATPDQPEDEGGMSTGAKIGLGLGVAGLAAGGMYAANQYMKKKKDGEQVKTDGDGDETAITTTTS